MSLLLSRFYPQASAVLTSGNQNISGIKNFDSRPTVRGTGVLLQGEAAGGGGPITLPSDILYTTGTQTITGPKNFTARPTLSGLNLITTGDLVNLELNIEGALASSSAFNGNRQIKAIPVNNTNYGGATISGFLERIFFPYINRTVSLNAFSTIHTYGYTSLSNINFIGNLPDGDDVLTGIGYYFAVASPLLRGPDSISNSTSSYDTSVPVSTGGLSISGTTASSYRTRIFVTRNGASTTVDSSPQGIRFEPPYFYGVSSNANLGLGVTGLTPSNPNTYTYALNSRPSQLPSATTFLDFTVTNGYIYFAYPSFTASNIINWGSLVTPLGGVVDSNNFDYTEQFNNNLVQTSINLPLYNNLNYRIYRSNLLTPINPNTLFRLRFTFA